MADDLQFSSNKRKFDDPSAGAPRRASGFSAGPPIASPPDSKVSTVNQSYNSVPPPADDIQLAKQRAQEIAARLFSAAEAKRPRVEGDGGVDGGDNGFGSAGSDHSYKPLGQQTSSLVGMTPPASFPSYGYQGSSKKIDIPNDRVGVIIGKGGETIKYLQLQSGAKIQVTRDMDADPNSQTRLVELTGTSEQISKAEQLISDVLAEAEAGGSGIVAARKFMGAQVGTEHFIMKVPNNKVGLIIGKGGETIKNMQAKSGARIQLIPLHLPPGDTSTERTVHIDGTAEQIEAAKQLVNEVTSGENRVRNPQIGGYSHQGYRPPRPQTSWAPPGAPPMQQPGYGYMQPGAYPPPPPQYSMSQPPYSGYPPVPTSAGYSSGWDQNTNQPSQQSAQGAGYDYYSQQGQSQQQSPSLGGSAAPADSTAYNYGQTQPSTYSSQASYGDNTYSQTVGQQQGYSQDGYGGSYQAPAQQVYSHPPTSAQPGYEQQNYNSASYPTMPSQDGSAPAYSSQGGSAQIPPAQQGPPGQALAAQQGYPQQPNTTSYPSQGSGQPGYGIAPTSQPGYGSQLPPPAYGQPQSAYAQPPLAQKAPTQAGYVSQPPPPAQSGYQGPPPSGFGPGSAQPAYGQQSYGAAPPQSQVGYGQQPQQSYADSYGAGGYSQPPVYSSDNASTGTGAYDAQATGQSISSGVTKASPKAQS